MGRVVPRKRTLRTRIDAFIQWALIALVVFAIILYLIAVLITEQPLIAAAIGLLLVAVPVGIWYRRRAVRRRQAWLHVQQAQQLGQLLTVSGEDFEDIAVDLFQAVGYRDFERIGGSGDLGVDLVGQDPDGRKVIIQCKRYGRGQKIGSPAVQALMGPS